jgi:hypothetical protein
MLTNVEIENVCRSSKIKLNGCYLRDQLHGKIPKNGLTMINLDTTLDGNGDGVLGSHWVCVISDERSCLAYDSFGAPACPEAEAFIRRRYRSGYGTNGYICQDIKADTCGWWCIVLAFFLQRKRAEVKKFGLLVTAEQFVSLFGDSTQRNEQILREMVGYLPPNRITSTKFATSRGGGIGSYLLNRELHVLSNSGVKDLKRGKAAVFGRTELPPACRAIVEKYADNIVVGATIKKTPVSAVLTGALDAVSMSNQFGKQTLYHLFLVLQLDNGTRLTVEKGEVVKMAVNERSRPNELALNVAVAPNLTFSDLVSRSQQQMGDLFLRYSARDSNCQRFVFEILSANGMGTQEASDFVLQDTKSKFDSTTSNTSNFITDLGASADVIMNGAGFRRPRRAK